MASVMTVDYLKQEAAKGNRSDFDYFLNLVPNEPPVASDEMPEQLNLKRLLSFGSQVQALMAPTK